jgi:hypothetical protein
VYRRAAMMSGLIDRFVSKATKANETHLPAKQPPSGEEARVSCSDGNSVGPSSIESPSRQGSRSAVGLAVR